jgi:hypothetical protein
MTVAVSTPSSEARPGWLWSPRWDLIFISLSVVLVAVPYAAYLGLVALGPTLQPLFARLGTDAEGFSRNLVNMSIALFIGGPHMYATLTRTALDRRFMGKHRRMAFSALAIPMVVVALAFLNLTLLLTIFFFWASIHVLHQIIYVTELYNTRKGVPGLRADLNTSSGLNLRANLSLGSGLFSRLADYAVVLTALYPLAAWKIVTGRFQIGTNDIGAVVGQFLPVGPWMVWLVGGIFGLALVAWLAKTVYDWRQGTLHVPKTVFIAVTVIASFSVPALGNLDTAFQGMNVWHSFQYMALTWILIHIQQERAQLGDSPLVSRLARTGSSRRYYGFLMAITAADVALAAVLFVVFRYALQDPFDLAFDRAYYIAVLSFLWMHYYFDHYLFTQPDVIAAPARAGG